MGMRGEVRGRADRHVVQDLPDVVALEVPVVGGVCGYACGVEGLRDVAKEEVGGVFGGEPVVGNGEGWGGGGDGGGEGELT